jgi:putative transposase
MGISRQAHYKRLACGRRRGQEHSTVVQLVTAHRREQPRIGTRKLHYLLREHLQHAGIKVGRDALFDILRDARMLVIPRRAYHKTTNSHHYYRRHPNLLKDGPSKMVPSGCEQLWVADITYLPTTQKTAYLSLVTDAYSRKIVGWHVHDGLDTVAVSQALKMALRKRCTTQPLVHHSDRGIQYCSNEYQRIHARHGITCSMTDGYDCYQNALAERINGILKTEFLLHRPAGVQEARKMVGESVRIYNEKRPHLSLEYETPEAVHQASLVSQAAVSMSPIGVNL